MNHKMICEIYKDNSLISEISVPMLMDASKLNKTTKKSKNKIEKKSENKDLVEQLNSLNELYKSGTLTKE